MPRKSKKAPYIHSKGLTGIPISEDQTTQIIELHEQGNGYRTIARLVGVGLCTVMKHCKKSRHLVGRPIPHIHSKQLHQMPDLVLIDYLRGLPSLSGKEWSYLGIAIVRRPKIYEEIVRLQLKHPKPQALESLRCETLNVLNL